MVAGAVAVTGKRAVAKGTPPVPTDAIESARTDVATVRQAVHR